MKALIDTSVIIDVLQGREPWRADGEKIFYAVANRWISGFISAKEAADIHYLTRKQFSGRPNTDAEARRVMEKLFSLFGLIDTLGIDCRRALTFENSDYEDAILIESAQRAEMDAIVTRNPGHFRASSIPVYSPDAFVRMLEQEYGTLPSG